MAYTPKTWACGDTITAEDLNHIEQGIANSGGGTEPLIVNIANRSLDKTWQEIHDAQTSGRLVLILYSDEGASVTDIVYQTTAFEGEDYQIFVQTSTDRPSYVAETASAYPTAFID